MVIFTELLLLFFFIYVMLFLKIPNVENDNYIFQELIIFMIIFLFTYVSQIIIMLKYNCRMSHQEIFNKSLQVATAGLIGYVLYIDLTIMDATKECMVTYSPYIKYLMITICIIAVIAAVRIIYLLFNNDSIACNKNT